MMRTAISEHVNQVLPTILHFINIHTMIARILIQQPSHLLPILVVVLKAQIWSCLWMWVHVRLFPTGDLCWRAWLTWCRLQTPVCKQSVFVWWSGFYCWILCWFPHQAHILQLFLSWWLTCSMVVHFSSFISSGCLLSKYCVISCPGSQIFCSGFGQVFSCMPPQPKGRILIYPLLARFNPGTKLPNYWWWNNIFGLFVNKPFTISLPKFP